MKKAGYIFSLLLFSMVTCGQVVFKTIVPVETVVEGESFRIQYVAEDADLITKFTAPTFNGFRVVNGPETYYGRSVLQHIDKPVTNTAYTLQATRPGGFRIKGATALINGHVFTSNDVSIIVITREEAEQQRRQNGSPVDNRLSFLKPGEDPYARIRENLFVKVTVDKKQCYAGEPVVATFRLYSRLRSRSDIVKNPGFYGFTVQDMISLGDRMVAVEKMDGRFFDVHTIRQVQLYPLRAGSFTIDPMEIKNEVEFSRSAVNKKTEQEIIEGVFEKKEREPDPNVEVFENIINTDAVNITVKPTPERNRPDEYNGAVGKFSVAASIEKKSLAKNEEGYLTVTVKGRGNFIQLSPPNVKWPAGIEGFEPVVVDSIDKKTSPLTGSKTFRYAFISTQPGTYQLPATLFSFFNPDTNDYHTVSTGTQEVVISPQEKGVQKIVVTEKGTSIEEFNRRASLIAAGIVVLLGIGAIIYWLTRKKQPVMATPVAEEPTKPRPAIDELLKPAYLLLPAADNDFYKVLQGAIWEFFKHDHEFSGTALNRHSLAASMQQKNIDPGLVTGISNILQECETHLYTGLTTGEEERVELLSRADQLLTIIEKEI